MGFMGHCPHLFPYWFELYSREQGTVGKKFPSLRFIISLCPNQFFLSYTKLINVCYYFLHIIL